MAKLILSMDGLVLKEIPLNKERVTIGRKPHNDIQIDNLAISGEHAVIVTILNDSFLEDLNSTNGTLVNGQPIKKHFLRNNDVVELGKYKLKYMAELPASGNADFEKTMVLRPGAVKPLEAAPPAASAAAGAPDPHGSTSVQSEARAAASAGSSAPSGAPPAPQVAAIQLLNGANAGKELELTKTLTTLGKPGVQVAVIAKRPQGYFITHVEGGQFPVVNGEALDAQAHPLKDHDVIEIAGIKMEFFLKV
jgi:pSer/pThr/pTyr-binding forkhead associated (FHA) protein